MISHFHVLKMKWNRVNVVFPEPDSVWVKIYVLRVCFLCISGVFSLSSDTVARFAHILLKEHTRNSLNIAHIWTCQAASQSTYAYASSEKPLPHSFIWKHFWPLYFFKYLFYPHIGATSHSTHQWQQPEIYIPAGLATPRIILLLHISMECWDLLLAACIL